MKNEKPEIIIEQKVLLSQILEKLNEMDHKIQSLSSIVDRVPEIISDITNTMDQYATQIQLQNQDPEKRIEDSLTLLNRLTQTETISRLQILLDLSEQLPNAVSDMANIFDSLMRQASEKGIDVEERCNKVQNLLETASSPEVLDFAYQAIETTKQSEDIITFAVDQVDDWMRFLTDNGLDINTLGKEGTQLLSVLYSAFNETLQKPIPRVNAFGVLKAMSHSDFQKFIGLLIETGKKIGKNLPDSKTS
ncbi:hypothetical protein [Membranihabitans maritimus]|uniref:hypothetical protein n=1 Tax=Membranihabitans maritimus TaxID=2904244 RepID=UPI001F2F9080|nr:hypothetical protein [Membranihabitans maritimus]